MTVRFEVTRPNGVYGVTLPAYKWGYTEIDRERIARSLGATATGTRYEERQAFAARELLLRFVEADDVLTALNNITYFALRLVRDVRFYPNYDTDPGTFWALDWATDITFTRVIDDRQEVEVRVVEKPVEL